MSTKFSFREIKDPSMELCSQLSVMQKTIWRMLDIDVIPAWKLLVTPKTGGKIIVAYDNEKPIAHGVFTHARNTNNESFLYLDLIGVLPEYQGKGIGENILQRAKEMAKKEGYSSIEWTYDPLESANGNLYIRKLRAVVKKYYPNYYGSLSGERHQGSVTDRFWTYLSLDRESEVYAFPDTVIYIRDYHLYKDLLIHNPDRVAIEIPMSFREIVAQNPEQARKIRYNTREIFMALLDQEYLLNGFHKEEQQTYYIAQMYKENKRPL